MYLINLISGKLKNYHSKHIFFASVSNISVWKMSRDQPSPTSPNATVLPHFLLLRVSVCVTVRTDVTAGRIRAWACWSCIGLVNGFGTWPIMRLSVMSHYLVNECRRNLWNNVIFNSESMWLNRLYNFSKSPVLSFNSSKFNSVLFLDHHLH